MFLIFYELLLWLLALLALPKMIYGLIFQNKYRNNLLERFGCNFPKLHKTQNQFPIWIHAVSVGETLAVASLARELKKQHPQATLIISSTTETGHAEAQRSLPFADHHVYLPLDFAWLVRKILKAVAPKLVVICESDFWFNFLYYAKKNGATLALVNGKLSERSMHRLHFFSTFSKRLFGLFDLMCVQNELYSERFIVAYAPKNKIVITGNLKLDADVKPLAANEEDSWRAKLGIQNDHTILTIGSTHNPEEKEILEILKNLWQSIPNFQVLLVPRRPETFKTVAALLDKSGLAWVSFTNIEQRTGKEKVVLMDTMGLLRTCYQISDIAIVGGSFIKHVGGHNILEPSYYGRPVLFGPHMESQRELVDLVVSYGAGQQVKHTSELEKILELWLRDPHAPQKIGAQGRLLSSSLKGSKGRTLQALASISPLNSI